MSTTRTEDLTDQVNGATASFATSVMFVPGTLLVALNGQLLRAGIGNDYVETSAQTFTLLLTPEDGEVLLAQYETEVNETGFPVVVAYGFDPTS